MKEPRGSSVKGGFDEEMIATFDSQQTTIQMYKTMQDEIKTEKERKIERFWLEAYKNDRICEIDRDDRVNP